MVTVTRSRSGGGRGRLASRGRATARSVTRTTGGRSASSASPRASVRTPARRTARPTRARSSPRSGGEGDDGSTTVAAMQAQMAEMQAEMQAREGAIQQLQAEVDDFRGANAAAPARSSTLPATGEGSDDEVAVTGTGHSDSPPPPPAFSPPTAHLTAYLRQVEWQEDLKLWRSPAALLLWFVTSERPVGTTLAAGQMQAILRDVAHVSSTVLDQLNAISGLSFRTFIADGDFVADATVPLPERLDVLIAVVTVLSRGITSDAGRSRIAALEAGLRRGLEVLRRQCNDCRSRMHVTANCNLTADLVEQDLDRWVGEWFKAATIGKEHRSAPAAKGFPPVITPTWTGLSTNINAGGLRNSQHQPRSPLSSGFAGGPRSSSALRSAKTQRPAVFRYCFAFAMKADAPALPAIAHGSTPWTLRNTTAAVVAADVAAAVGMAAATVAPALVPQAAASRHITGIRRTAAVAVLVATAGEAPAAAPAVPARTTRGAGSALPQSQLQPASRTPSLSPGQHQPQRKRRARCRKEQDLGREGMAITTGFLIDLLHGVLSQKEI